MAVSTPDIGKLKRSYLLHFIDASFGTGESPKWYLIGKDIDDMSVELSPDTSTVKNILDETSVNDNGYEPTLTQVHTTQTQATVFIQKLRTLQ